MRFKLDAFENLRGLAPQELLDFLEQLLRLLPPEFRYRLKRVIDSLPREGDNMQRVLELVRNQWRDIRSEHWVKIAIAGPGQTGKASLLRAIRRKQLEPGEPIFSIVETPGLEEFLGYRSTESTPAELREADLILLVLDGRYGVSDSTREMVQGLQSLDKPILAVLNKMDVVEKPAAVLSAARKSLNISTFPASALRPDSIDKLLDAIVATDSRALYPLTRTFPEFRRSICSGVVTQASLASGLVGALPIPVSDMLPMTAIQTGMLLKIARAFGFPLNQRRARELVPMLAAGTLVREGTHRLRRRFPRQARLIAVSAAGAWTYLLGRAAIAYFQSFNDALQGKEPAETVRVLREVTA